MRRNLLMLFACVAVLSIAGCGGKETTEIQEELVETEEEESYEEFEEIEENIENSEDISYATLLPNVEDFFENGEIIIIDPDGGEAYAFRITNYQDGEYEAYVEACKDMGFDDVSYEGENDGGKMFYAYSSDGVYYLQAMLGYQIEAIDVSCKTSSKHQESTEEESEETETTEKITSDTQISDSDIRPEFKEALDSYEAFFDEYVAFMKKYAESDDVVSMLSDYSSYLAQYADTMEKLDAIGDEEMTTAEAAYYLEVTTRINQKILEAVQ